MANLTFAQLEALVAQAGGTPSQQEILAGIAAGPESGGNPTAQNPTSTASGLWQELTTTWLGNGGGQYAPTAKQASPLDQAIVAVRQSVGGYQPGAPDLGGAYGGGGSVGNPQTPAPGSPVANYLKSIGVTGPGTNPVGTPPAGAVNSATTASFPGGSLDPLNIPGEIAGAGGSAVASGILGVINTITAPLKAFVVNSSLVVFGVILLAVAVIVIAHSASSGSSTQIIRETTRSSGTDEEEGDEEEEEGEGEGEGEHEEHHEETTHTTEKVSTPRSSSKGAGGKDSAAGPEAKAMESEAQEAPEAVAAAAAA